MNRIRQFLGMKMPVAGNLGRNLAMLYRIGLDAVGSRDDTCDVESGSVSCSSKGQALSGLPFYIFTSLYGSLLDTRPVLAMGAEFFLPSIHKISVIALICAGSRLSSSSQSFRIIL